MSAPGEEKNATLLFALFFAAAALLSFSLAYRVRGANNLYEFCHYADIAQNWTQGGGYATRIVEPGVLAEMEARGLALQFPLPVTYRFPLYSALVSLFILVLGFSDLAVALVNGAVHAGLAVLIFLLGKRLYGGRTAKVAALLYVTSPVFAARYAISGFTDPISALTLLPLHFLLSLSGSWSRRTAAAAGAILGLSYLARFNVNLFIPVYAALAWRKTDRAGFALFGLAAALAVAPLWAYNVKHFGGLSAYPMATMNLAAFTAVPSPDPWRLYRTFSLAEVVASHWPQIAYKAFRGFFGEFLPGLMTIWNLPILVVFFFSGIFQEKDAPRRRFWLLGAGLLLLQGVAFSPLRLELSIPNEYYRGRYFFWFAPTLLLAGCHYFLARLPAGRLGRGLLAGFLLVSVLVEFGDFRPAGYHFDAERDPVAAALSPLDAQTTLLVSNMAVQAAAYYRLNSIELPLTPEEFRKIQERHPVTHLYLDGGYFLTEEWRRLLGDKPRWNQFQSALGFRRSRVVWDEQGRFEGELWSAEPKMLNSRR